jgi:hypothetical protein
MLKGIFLGITDNNNDGYLVSLISVFEMCKILFQYTIVKANARRINNEQ